MNTIRDSHAFVLAEARANVEFVKQSAANVEQAQQINASLANIVAMERNMVMLKAVERAAEKDRIHDLPRIPKERPAAPALGGEP